MSARIRVAVIGVGHMGTFHARLWRRCEAAEMVGVYDIVPDRARAVAQELGVTAFETLEQALEAAQAVTLATPAHTHAELLRMCLHTGRHCLVEKPLATSLADAQDVVELSARTGAVLMVGHSERFNPAFRWLCQQSFPVRFVESHRLHPFRPRSTDVSVVLDVMIHDLELLAELLDAPVEQVQAHGVPVLTPLPDIVNARLQFANGCVANVTASRVSAKFLRKMRLFGPNRYVALDFAQQSLELVCLQQEPPGAGEELLAEYGSEDGHMRRIVRGVRQFPQVNALQEEHRAFLECIRSGHPDPALPYAMAALQWAQQIESAVMAAVSPVGAP